MWDGNRRLARIGFGGLDSPFPYSLDIPQTDTEAILHAPLARAGVTVARGTELTGLAADPDGVDAKLRGPDGSISAVRAAAALRTCGPAASRPASGDRVHRRGTLRAGDRAPDPSGLLHDTRHTLLVLGGSPLTALRRLAGRTGVALRLVVVGEGDSATRRAYPAGVYLVRPDGYVAAIGVEAAEAYLRRVFPLP